MRALAARLEEGLARGGSAGALEELWQGVELELVRQACVHCAERGELMEAVRRRREAQAGVMRRQVAAQRLELQQLRRDVEMLDMVGAALSARGAEAVSQEQRRVRLLSEVCAPSASPSSTLSLSLSLRLALTSTLGLSHLPPAQAVCDLSTADKGTVVQEPLYSQLVPH